MMLVPDIHISTKFMEYSFSRYTSMAYIDIIRYEVMTNRRMHIYSALQTKANSHLYEPDFVCVLRFTPRCKFIS